MTTARTGLGRTTGVDRDHGNTGTGGFVRHQVNPWPEGPRTHHPTKTLAPAHPAANPVQRLKDHHRAFIHSGKITYRATHLVVDVPYSTPLRVAHRLDPVQTVVLRVAPAQIRDVLRAMTNRCTSEALNRDWSTHRCPAHGSQINADERGFTVTDGRRVTVNAQGQHRIPITVSLKQLSVTVDRLHAVAPFDRDTQRQPDITAAGLGRAAQNPTPVVFHHSVSVHAETKALRSGRWRESGPLLALGLTQPIVRPGPRHRGGERLRQRHKPEALVARKVRELYQDEFRASHDQGIVRMFKVVNDRKESGVPRPAKARELPAPFTVRRHRCEIIRFRLLKSPCMVYSLQVDHWPTRIERSAGSLKE